MDQYSKNTITEKRILIVEDDRLLSAGLARALGEAGRTTEICGNIREARRALARRRPDLMILDINLPDGNGYDFLTELRREQVFPIILLTANDMEADIVTGLEAGADDYITKPFSLAVLRARVNAQLRRQVRDRQADRDAAVWTSGDFRFCFDRMEYYVDGRAVDLSRNEQRLLRILVENEGITLTRGTLIDKIWTDEAEYVDENALSVTVKRLRDKLGAADRIQTVYGVGYVWVKKDGQD